MSNEKERKREPSDRWPRPDLRGTLRRRLSSAFHPRSWNLRTYSTDRTGCLKSNCPGYPMARWCAIDGWDRQKAGRALEIGNARTS